MDKIYRYDLTKAVLILLAVFLAWQLKFIFIILLISFVLTVVLYPFVQKLHKVHLPAALAILLPLTVVVLALTTVATYLGPPVLEQIPRFLSDFPNYISSLPFSDLISPRLEAASDYLVNNFGGVDQIVVLGTVLIKAFVGALTVIVITIYWLGSYDETKATLLSYIPKKYQLRGYDIWQRIEYKLGKWFIGQVLVSFSVGVLVWAAARLLGLPYAGVLGLISALFEIIPNVGPVLAAFPAILIGASESLEKAIAVTLTYIFIQQFENHILTPQLMGRTVKLHPIIIIVSILTGGITLGVAGALFAVPTALLFSAFVDSFRSGEPKKELPKSLKKQVDAS